MFNHFYGGGNNWKENHDPPQATVRSGIHWKDKVCIGNVPDCDQNLVKFNFSQRLQPVGRPAPTTAARTSSRCLPTMSPSIRGKHTFKFGGQYPVCVLQRLRPPVHLGLHRLSISSIRHAAPRRIDTNFTTAAASPIASMLLGYANAGNRHDPLHRPAVAFVCRIRPGRLAHAAEPGGEPRAPLGDRRCLRRARTTTGATSIRPGRIRAPVDSRAR